MHVGCFTLQCLLHVKGLYTKMVGCHYACVVPFRIIFEYLYSCWNDIIPQVLNYYFSL